MSNLTVVDQMCSILISSCLLGMRCGTKLLNLPNLPIAVFGQQAVPKKSIFLDEVHFFGKSVQIHV